MQCNTAGPRPEQRRDRHPDSGWRRSRRRCRTGYFIEYGGQFESQQAATRMIGLLSLISLAGMFLALYTLFRSANLALQVLSALPMAAIGAVAALVITGQSLTVASMVGFISLAGIASRNGILLIAHYLHLVKYEGEQFTPEMIERAGKERLAPMLMTALTAGIALVPLVLAAGEPGKEILYPVATVILGGLISSTLLDFFVHPALFWLFGRQQAEQHIHDKEGPDELEEQLFRPAGAVQLKSLHENQHAPAGGVIGGRHGRRRIVSRLFRPHVSRKKRYEMRNHERCCWPASSRWSLGLGPSCRPSSRRPPANYTACWSRRKCAVLTNRCRRSRKCRRSPASPRGRRPQDSIADHHSQGKRDAFAIGDLGGGRTDQAGAGPTEHRPRSLQRQT